MYSCMGSGGGGGVDLLERQFACCLMWRYRPTQNSSDSWPMLTSPHLSLLSFCGAWFSVLFTEGGGGVKHGDVG